MADIIKYVTQSMMKRLTRSSLTILSILIGIMAIYALLSFGQGLQKYINDVGEKSGTDKLIVQMKGFGPPGSSPSSLTQNDIDTIHRVSGVDEAAGVVAGQVQVKSKDAKVGKYVFVMGLEPGPTQRMVEQSMTLEIYKGRDLQRGDSKKAVIGYNYQIANKIFDKPIEIGDKITVNDVEYKVAGFFKEIGNPQDDTNIFITADDAKDLFKTQDYQYIIVKANSEESPSQLADVIAERLRREKHQKEGQEDFFVQTFEDALATFSTIVTVLNAILVIIAAISVVVAAVNIMNTMYTAVLERTKEIGVMKAIGAQNSTILSIFIFESGFLGLIGGALGILLGYGIAKAGGAIAASAGYSILQPYFPWWLTVGCLLFALIVGMASGFFPARAASHLSPVEALRYE
jgi:putative ABC transport system permease protein